MWIRGLCSLWLILGVGVSLAMANGYVETSGSYSEGETIRGDRYDTGGNKKSTLGTLLSGEDQNNNLLRVELQYSRGLAVGADTLIKTGTGYIHRVVCWGSDVAATAGDIAVRDAVAAGAGTVVMQFQIAAALYSPNSVELNIPVTTGIYLDYTTTNDITCTVSYR